MRAGLRVVAHHVWRGRHAPLSAAVPGDLRVLQVIPVYHSIYAEADPALISLINEHCAHGSFRTWAKFTLHAQRFLERTARRVLDEEVARNVFARLGGGRHWATAPSA